LLLTDFGIGYRWQSWGVFYRMQQPIPLSVNRREENMRQEPVSAIPTGEVEDKDTWKDWFKKLPPGNRQTLTIEYVF
jgi:hypothetical protein